MTYNRCLLPFFKVAEREKMKNYIIFYIQTFFSFDLLIVTNLSSHSYLHLYATVDFGNDKYL